MSLALTEEHRSLADVARSLLADHGGIDQARATLDTKDEVLPAFWAPFKENGMFGLHLPEEFGGQGFGLEETAIVVEELTAELPPPPPPPQAANKDSTSELSTIRVDVMDTSQKYHFNLAHFSDDL